MDIGIRLHDTVPGTLEERLRFVRGQGFSCAHLALSKAVEGFSMNDAPARLADPDFAPEVKSAFEKTDMRCAVLGCYLNLADPDPESRERTREIYCAHLRFAPKMGAETVGTETPANPASPFAEKAAESEEAFSFFLDCLRPVVRCAEENGAILAVEPVYRHIVSTPKRALRMLEEINSDSLRIILDAVNLLGPDTAGRAEEIIGEAIRLLGDRVSVLHMKDCMTAQGSVEALPCGMGDMKYEALLSFAAERNLPMTLENTAPENAEAARLYLEKKAVEAGVGGICK